MIVTLCQRMSVNELEAFVTTSYRNLSLCSDILKEKIKQKILDLLNELPEEQILDV